MFLIWVVLDQGTRCRRRGERWVTSSVGLVDGQAQYSLLCNEQGGVVDDISFIDSIKIIFYSVSMLQMVEDFNWLQGSILSEHDVQVTNASDDYAQV